MDEDEELECELMIEALQRELRNVKVCELARFPTRFYVSPCTHRSACRYYFLRAAVLHRLQLHRNRQ